MVLKSSTINYYQDDGESFAKVDANSLSFTCRIAGLDNKGDAVILLHGFPETSHMWHKLIPLLKNDGFIVIAPDQRGYSMGARPSGKNAYKIENLVQDVLSIADAFGIEKFHLVGHDWGSAVGWAIVSRFPDRIKSWTALSVPHLSAFLNSYKTNTIQKKKSQYISFFLKPFIPEIYFKIFKFKNLKKIWNYSTDIQITKYLDVFKQPKAIKSALHWYRANIENEQKLLAEIITPTILIWGEKDMAIGYQSIKDTQQFMKGSYQLETLKAGHWLIQEKFESVSKLILLHLNNNKNRN